MACNCKQAKNLEDVYGMKDDSSLSRAYRTTWKVITLLIGLVLGIIVTPITIFVMIYNQLFRGGKPIKLPVWLLRKKPKK